MQVDDMEVTLRIRIDEETTIEVSEAKARVLMEKLQDLFGETEAEEEDNSDFWKRVPLQPQQPQQPWWVPNSPNTPESPWAKQGEITWTAYTSETDNVYKTTSDSPQITYNNDDEQNSVTIDIANSYR